LTARLTPERRALAAQFAPEAARIAVRMVKQARAFHFADVARSAALEATAEAAATYDLSSDVPFEGFAWRRVVGEILDALRNERRHWSAARVGGLDAATQIEDPSDVLSDTDSDTVDQLDSLIDEVMAGALLSFASEIWRTRGEAGLLLRETHTTTLAALSQALSRLDSIDRRLVDLRYWQGSGWEDVSGALGIPERTVKRRDQQIRRRLGVELRARGVRTAPDPEGRVAEEHP
jgi:RNA polymerase sigma factor FliA